LVQYHANVLGVHALNDKGEDADFVIRLPDDLGAGDIFDSIGGRFQ